MRDSLIEAMRRWVRSPDPSALGEIQDRLSGTRKKLLTHPRNIAEYAFSTWEGIDEQEQLHLLSFDHSGGLISDTMVSKGGEDCSELQMRDLCRLALENSAFYTVVMHNHPSQSAAFSQQDRKAEKQIRRALGLIGIQMVDFIVVSGRLGARGGVRYSSYAEKAERREAKKSGGVS